MLFFEDVEVKRVCLISHSSPHLQCDNKNVNSYMIAPHSQIRLSNTHSRPNCVTTEYLSGCEEGNNIAI